MIRLLRLGGLTVVVGCISGLLSLLFLHALQWATDTRIGTPWLVWFLPIAGFIIGLTYLRFGAATVSGTTLVVEQSRSITVGIPTVMTPLIFSGATLGHLVGASVGREGVALQMSGSMADTLGRFATLSRDDRRLLVVASLAAGFGGMFGVPVAGVLFALSVSQSRRPLALVVSSMATACAWLTIRQLGYNHHQFPQLADPGWSASLLGKLIVLGILLGLVGRVYLVAVSAASKLLAHSFRWLPVRTAVGGAATLVLIALVGRDYLGLSLPLAYDSMVGIRADWFDPILKMLFTVVALASGFVGGEMVPLFVIGATSAAALAPILHLPIPLAAALGFGAVFAASSRTPAAGVALATELFGWSAFLPAGVVLAAARLSLGRSSLYSERGVVPAISATPIQ